MAFMLALGTRKFCELLVERESWKGQSPTYIYTGLLCDQQATLLLIGSEAPLVWQLKTSYFFLAFSIFSSCP